MRPHYSRRAGPAFVSGAATSIIIRQMRPLILALLVALGFAAPARAGQAPATAGRGARQRRRRRRTVRPTTSSSAATSKARASWTRRSRRTSRRLLSLPTRRSSAPSSPGSTRGTTAAPRRSTRRRPPSCATRQPGSQQDPRHHLRCSLGAAAGRSGRATTRPDIRPAPSPRSRRRAGDGTFDLNVDLMLGRLYAQTGDFEKALPLLRHVVDDQPGYQEGALLLAAAEESAGHTDDAIGTLERDAAGQPGFLPRAAPARGDLRARRALAAGGAGAGAGAGAQHHEHVAGAAARGRLDQRRQGGRGARRARRA